MNSMSGLPKEKTQSLFMTLETLVERKKTQCLFSGCSGAFSHIAWSSLDTQQSQDNVDDSYLKCSGESSNVMKTVWSKAPEHRLKGPEVTLFAPCSGFFIGVTDQWQPSCKTPVEYDVVTPSSQLNQLDTWSYFSEAFSKWYSPH